MVLNQRYRISKEANLPLFSSRKEVKSYSSLHQREDLSKSGSYCTHNVSTRLHNSDMAPICKARNRSVKVFPDPKEVGEDDELSDHLRKVELPDDDDCLWLSSGSSSPSSCSENYRLSGYLDVPLDTWFSFMLSASMKFAPFLGNAITFFDGSRVTPIEEASLVLDQKLSLDEEVILKENLKEEEQVVSWLVTSVENESIDLSCATCSEDTESSSGCNGLSLFSPKRLISHSRRWSNDIAGFLASLVNIDGEDSKLISDAESEYLELDFPSPSCKGFRYSEIESSSSSAAFSTEVSDEKPLFPFSSVSDNTTDIVDLEEFSTDKPLSWPSDSSPEWGSESKWDYFVMSPRRSHQKVVYHDRTSPQPLRFRVVSGQMNLEKGCKRRLLFSQGSNPRSINNIPSRLKKSNKTCMKIVPLDEEHDLIEPAEEKVFSLKPQTISKMFLVEEFESNETSNEGIPIESLLGLDEFDGHEGVNSEFNKDEFSFLESL